MSETDHSAPQDEEQTLAAEYVLGVLGLSERRAVEVRIGREPAFAREVADWEERLGGLADGVRPVTPPPPTWDAIETALAPPKLAQSGLWQSVIFWRSFAIGSAALAAASLTALAYLGLVAPQREPMLATLGGSGGQPNFVAAVSPRGDSLIVVPAALLTSDQRALELWVIPPGDRPHSLGVIKPGQPVRIDVPPDLRARLTRDAVLAVTLEPPGGSPTGLPTGPVVANGKLTSL
jgi:anti-sigma-K factor RskA